MGPPTPGSTMHDPAAQSGGQEAWQRGVPPQQIIHENEHRMDIRAQKYHSENRPVDWSSYHRQGFGLRGLTPVKNVRLGGREVRRACLLEW